MIIFLEASSDVDKSIVPAFKYYGYNSQVHNGLINQFINHIADVYKGKYTKEDLVTAFNRMYKRNVVLTEQKISPSVRTLAGGSHRQIQNSNQNNYEASPNIMQRLYSPRQKMMMGDGGQLNKYEQDTGSKQPI